MQVDLVHTLWGGESPLALSALRVLPSTSDLVCCPSAALALTLGPRKKLCCSQAPTEYKIAFPFPNTYYNTCGGDVCDGGGWVGGWLWDGVGSARGGGRGGSGLVCMRAMHRGVR